eukprot:25201-Amphidinium_carterae.1
MPEGWCGLVWASKSFLGVRNRLARGNRMSFLRKNASNVFVAWFGRALEFLGVATGLQWAVE